uniref:Transmembrane protein 128 n=1 Tax=Pogona vitticeps TaxID=103695 RepID=A0ABM5FGJ0_9SAUR
MEDPCQFPGLADSDVMVDEEKTASAEARKEEDLLQPLLRLRRRQLLGDGPDSELQQPSSSPGMVVEATNTETTIKEKPLPRLNLHSAFWILASIATTYYAEFFKNVKEMILQENWWFMLGSFLLMISLSVAFYCILYLEWYRGIKDYDARYPALIPVTTASFIVAAVCFNISLWPVWSFVTPLVLFVQFMGVVMLVSLLG